MKIYIWEYVENVTSNYHSGGGAAVVAPDLAAARKALRDHQVEDRDGDSLEPIEDPDRTLLLADDTVDPEVFIFPDAGCC